MREGMQVRLRRLTLDSGADWTRRVGDQPLIAFKPHQGAWVLQFTRPTNVSWVVGLRVREVGPYGGFDCAPYWVEPDPRPPLPKVVWHYVREER